MSQGSALIHYNKGHTKYIPCSALFSAGLCVQPSLWTYSFYPYMELVTIFGKITF